MEKSWKRIISMGDQSDTSSSGDSQDNSFIPAWKRSLMSSKRSKFMSLLDEQGTSSSAPSGYSAVLVSSIPNPSDVLMHHDYVGTSRHGLNGNSSSQDPTSQLSNIDNVLIYSKIGKLRNLLRGRHYPIYNNHNPSNNTWLESDPISNREHETSQELIATTVLAEMQLSASTSQLPANIENRLIDEIPEIPSDTISETSDGNRNSYPVSTQTLEDPPSSLARESVLISPVKIDQQGNGSNPLENGTNSPMSERSNVFPSKEIKSANNKDKQEILLSQDGNLNEILLGLLECPVCWEVMPPPIYQCQRGHLLCRPCRKRISTCPTCRANLSSSRNLAMEKVAEKLKYPCKNSNSGCTIMVGLRDKRDHEANCPQRLYTCLSLFCAPRWTCKLDVLMLHYENSHSDMLRRGPKHTLHIPVNHDFYKKVVSHVWILLAFDKLFSVNLRVVPPGEVFGCVQYIGPHSISWKYIYELKSHLTLDTYRCARFERTTHSDQSNIDKLYSMKDCFYLSENWTKTLKSDDTPRSFDYLEIFVSIRAV